MAQRSDGSTPLQSLTLTDLSDTALLLVFDAALDADGTALSSEVAQLLELDTEHPTQNVGIRLSWLARYGVVKQNDNKRWQFTTQGEKAFRANLTKGQANTLARVADEALLEVMHRLGARLPDLNPVNRALVRREWNHNHARSR